MKKYLFIAALMLRAGFVNATPIITYATGTATTQQGFDIGGSGFDAKTDQKLIIYWDGLSPNGLQTDLAVSSNSFAYFQSTMKSTTVAEQRISGVYPMVTVSTWNAAEGTGDAGKFVQTWVTLRTGSTDYAFKYLMGKYTRETYTQTKSGANVKRFRVFNDDFNASGGDTNRYPNIYIGHRSVDTNDDVCEYVELLTLNGGCRFYSDPVSSTWHLQVLRIKTASAADQKDGVSQLLNNNTSEHLQTDLATSQSGNPGSHNGIGSPTHSFNWQHEWSNFSPGTINGNAWHDALFLNFGWNMAWLGDAATWSACTHVEPQPFTSWTSTSAHLNLRAGTFAAGTTAYMYVTDNSYVPNAAGYAIAIGNVYGAGGGATAPTVTSLSPNNGPTAGGTDVTITGTGFAAGATVSFNGSAGTNVTVVSATSITCKTPARNSGAVDVSVTNTTLLSGTATGAYTYNAPPTPTTVCPCK